MKKIYYALFLGLLLFSCKKSSTENESTVLDAVTSDAEALALANAVYSPLQTLSSSYSFLVESGTESTISFEGTEDENGPLVSRFETTPTNWYPVKVFSRLYKSIAAANIAIERIGAADTSKVTQATKVLTIARATFVRGYDYFNLVQLFGEVPLVLSSTSTNVTRASINEVYAQIVKDLTAAKVNLPEVDVTNKSNPSREAANTILAKVYLTWGQNPLSQSEVEAIESSTTDPDHTVTDTLLEKAVAYADSVISSGDYTLLTDYDAIFGSSQENGNEHIFTIHHDGDAVDAQGNHETHCSFTNKFDLLTDNHIGPADTTLLNRFDDNDTRKSYSYSTDLINPVDLKTYHFGWPNTTSRYGKFIHRAAVGSKLTTEDQPNDIDHIDFRYAEVLLIKAEALLFLGRASEGLPLVNQLRERAYGSNQYDLSTLTKDALYKEWDLEFTYEQKHWTNLVRWRTLISTVKTVSGFEYYKDAYASEESIAANFPGVTVNSAFFAKIYKHLHAKYNNVNGKFYRFPIPVGESGEDLGITPQNPGY
jgi:starch-binding outer membrane protein, SusD/RagB family